MRTSLPDFTTYSIVYLYAIISLSCILFLFKCFYFLIFTFLISFHKLYNHLNEFACLTYKDSFINNKICLFELLKFLI